MRRFTTLFLALALVFVTGACDAFVDGVDEPIDTASSGALNDEDQVPFAINGVLAQWADTHDAVTVASDLLSDQFRFGTNGNATFPQYIEIDTGIPERTNNTVDGVFNNLGQYRFLADDLANRIESGQIEFTEDAPVSRNEALYEARLHGGIARYYYATYFGLNPREGGGVINRSAFIPSTAMYDSAKVKLDQAIERAPSEADAKISNSIAARNELYQGDFEAAAGYIQNGMVSGDDPFNVLYAVNDNNEWWNQAGRGRVQIVASDNQVNSSTAGAYRDVDGLRNFTEIVLNTPAEAARTPLVGIQEGPAFADSLTEEGVFEAAQDKYPEQPSPITFMSWQESDLIRAELAVRGALDADPLALVNGVRESFDLEPRTGSVTLEVIAEERDRTLFATGARLVDQRRFDFVEWHLVDELQGQTTWQYLPITQSEINDNDNINP